MMICGVRHVLVFFCFFFFVFFFFLFFCLFVFLLLLLVHTTHALVEKSEKILMFAVLKPFYLEL